MRRRMKNEIKEREISMKDSKGKSEQEKRARKGGEIKKLIEQLSKEEK